MEWSGKEDWKALIRLPISYASFKGGRAHHHAYAHHIMLTIQGFFVLFAIILQLMILYFLTEMSRAVQRRVTAEVREQRAVRRRQLNRNGERRRRGGESANYSVPTNRNRHPTENDERQG